jgi:hypothetical protein
MHKKSPLPPGPRFPGFSVSGFHDATSRTEGHADRLLLNRGLPSRVRDLGFLTYLEVTCNFESIRRYHDPKVLAVVRPSGEAPGKFVSDEHLSPSFISLRHLDGK